ncbi:ribonuclease H-like domain-containing protein [Mycena pura]|uniref:Ribonuclease H-like domain-containing protein n=1 Tax=Mycena pura TaxID=153505 RepID=A0AAD6Y699_9AGAR|nr:ribonuclease H-like domain-containing protein [Mycena pura]
MPPTLGAAWGPFYRPEDRPNGKHNRGYHWRCVYAMRPSSAAAIPDVEKNWKQLEKLSWFDDVISQMDQLEVHVNGEKKALAGHLRHCAHSTDDERKLAAQVNPTKKEAKEAAADAERRAKKRKAGVDESNSDADDEGSGHGNGGTSRKRKAVRRVESSLKQSQLKVFKGIDLPFTKDQKTAIEGQTLRATQSANLPERWTDDPEVLKLFMMLRSRAGEVIPSRAVLGGRLLDEANDAIDAQTKEELEGESVLMSTDGWRSNRRDAVGGVALSHKFRSFLIDLIRTNKLGKDGPSMRDQFWSMITEAEKNLLCHIIAFLTDNDGGSKLGRNLLREAHPWLLVFACVSHQGQLTLGDYIKENTEAEQLIGELIDSVNWINNHDKVRAIFDEYQENTNGNILAYLLPNLTRWTTHLVAALRFVELKVPIRNAILKDRNAIVAAQKGAEKNARKRQELEEDALDHCAVLEPNSWWDRLEKKIIPDLEHICYLTNISQSDHVRPDQFLLALAGLYLHFHSFLMRTAPSERALGKRMCKRIEKRWKEFDQVVFILALILNPFEGLSRFGAKANLNIFELSAELVKLYKRMRSRPTVPPRNEDQQAVFNEELNREAQEINTAFVSLLAGTGDFRSWHNDETHRKTYMELYGDDPIPFYEMLLTNTKLVLFANFALTLLRLVVNQAGLERWFSDFANKKNKKRNRLGLKKMVKQAKVTRIIREQQYTEGLADKREGRKNHNNTAELLAVPRYADAVLSDTEDSEDEAEKKSVLIKSASAWKRQIAEWQKESREADELDSASSSSEGDEAVADAPGPSTTTKKCGRAARNWLPATLERLFVGNPPNSIRLERRVPVLSEEGRLMELLQAEWSGEDVDDGEKEGSGDDFRT